MNEDEIKDIILYQIQENRKDEIINSLVKKYKKQFKDLNEKEQILLVYKEIIKLKKNSESTNGMLPKEQFNRIIAIIKVLDYNYGILNLITSYDMENNNKIYKDLYKESLVSYNKILENYKLLANELKINNSLDLSHLFTYMLWNGYYSVNKKHSYQLRERLLLPEMHSFDVIKGRGVCLAYAELLSNYLIVCNKKSAVLNCDIPIIKKNISYEYRPKIERNINVSVISEMLNKIFMIFSKLLVNNVGNHAVTLIEENGKMFLYDPTNLCVLNINNENIASIINGKGEYRIKPFLSFVLDSTFDSNQLFKKLLLGNIEPAFTKKEIMFSFENMMELINDNINLLNYFYDNIHSELEFIDKQTDEIGGYFKVLKKM